MKVRQRIIDRIITYIRNGFVLFLLIFSLYLAISISAVIQMEREISGAFNMSIIVYCVRRDGINICDGSIVRVSVDSKSNEVIDIIQ